jgi:hypothetical protein
LGADLSCAEDLEPGIASCGKLCNSTRKRSSVPNTDLSADGKDWPKYWTDGPCQWIELAR